MHTSTALRAISDPRRRRILMLVWDDELCAGEIASFFDVSRPAISQHLRVLREAKLIEERRHGTKRLYSVCSATMYELRRFLEHFTIGDFLWDEEVDGPLAAVA